LGAILVTGGAGFIGSHLCDRLVRDGREVVCLDVFDNFYPKDQKLRNIEAMKEAEHYHLYEGDIREPAVLEELFGHHDLDAVVHLAARAGVRPSLEMPRLYTDVNVTGTATLLEHCRVYRVPRFIFGSSSSVYGNSDVVPFAESAAAAKGSGCAPAGAAPAASCVIAPRKPGASNVMLVPGSCSRARDPKIRTVVVIPLVLPANSARE